MMSHASTIALAASLLGAAFAGCTAPENESPSGEIAVMTVAASGVQPHERRAAANTATASAHGRDDEASCLPRRRVCRP